MLSQKNSNIINSATTTEYTQEEFNTLIEATTWWAYDDLGGIEVYYKDTGKQHLRGFYDYERELGAIF